ncbi:preprotein translocase, SecE subunit [Orientia tsutsugamushi str. UT144]|uniref:Preprotein translocase, SecE subunit n=1 Tax=Orientia tsutsugamushi str. UT144 TaxID=1441384 RepID=A0A0F3RKA5_ORITS|nr:preprotein translocase subunit SecE [Orientia tsutsugamushi]KJW06481.1 preprotein translocase, SecE subunit [Orientia tsutsugamushi str. UT144]
MLKVKRMIEFCKQVKSEAMKVVWVDIREVWISVLVVLVAVGLFSILCVMLDYGIYNIVQLLLNIGK